MKKLTLHIIYRACDKVFARGVEIQPSSNKPSRPFCQDKTALVMTCFLSLVKAIEVVKNNVDINIHVVADALSPPLISFFESHKCVLHHGVYGNDDSLRTCFRLALTLPNEDYVYFCEDDYLHTESALQEMTALILHRQIILTFQPKKYRWVDILQRFNDLPLFIHPSDYPDRYTDRGRSRFSLIFQSPIPPYTHWRQIQNSTFTFATQVKNIRHFEKTFMASCVGAHDGLLSRLFRGWPLLPKSLCVSPIPSLAAHLHTHTLPRGGEWESLFLKHYQKIHRGY